jgi:hypothetical protein
VSGVLIQDWKIDAAISDGRRRLLLHPPSSIELAEQVAHNAMSAAKQRTLQIKWTKAQDRHGNWRIEAAIPIQPNIFDQFFNGRTGYRAQYYLSVRDGQTFNRLVIEYLKDPVRLASNRCRPFVSWSLIAKSLLGPHSKIWIVGDWAAFVREPEQLQPDRWVQHSQFSRDKPLGLCMPMPPAPQLDLKGTFICPASSSIWLPTNKKYRDQKIHESGWT